MLCTPDPILETKTETMKMRYSGQLQSECAAHADGRFCDFPHPMADGLETIPVEPYARASI